MRAAIERQAALMRLRNAESTRKNLFARIKRQLAMGQLTLREAIQIKNEFWQRVRKDKHIAAGVR